MASSNNGCGSTNLPSKPVGNVVAGKPLGPKAPK